MRKEVRAFEWLLDTFERGGVDHAPRGNPSHRLRQSELIGPLHVAKGIGARKYREKDVGTSRYASEVGDHVRRIDWNGNLAEHFSAAGFDHWREIRNERLTVAVVRDHDGPILADLVNREVYRCETLDTRVLSNPKRMTVSPLGGRLARFTLREVEGIKFLRHWIGSEVDPAVRRPKDEIALVTFNKLAELPNTDGDFGFSIFQEVFDLPAADST